ncbi:MAG: reverse transcriptase family protein, partial [Candidatus Scalindua sp.]|nr:reverse transcriptase family protein [Candidatus Scalindua sp.]
MGPDGIPAILLKKLKKDISKPLAILLRRSIDEGKIPEIFKMAYVTPIHKGGTKQKPEQYRPVSLTSHIMKVFERVIKKKILSHLVENKMFNKGQHGFVPGRSTQTQLLSHYNDIFDTLSEGKRLDTVFLHFAKAFDKVDHEILLEKVKKHKISGKIGKWIKEFLTNRKFRVVANGCMSEEGDVISGVPQGTVLAAVLFVIKILD